MNSPKLRLKYVVQCHVDRADDTSLPYVGLENIESWTARYNPTAAADTPDGSSAIRFSKKDVLFGKLRPYLAKAYLPDSDGRCSSEALVRRPSHRIRREFLLYVLLSKPLLDQVNSATQGAKMPRASWEDVGDVPWPVPSPAAQQAVVAFLDRKTVAIDALIAKKEQLLALLAEKRDAVINEAVTKGLDQGVPMKDSGVAGLGMIPAHWELKQLMHLTPPTRPIMYGIVLPGPNVDHGVLIVKSGDCRPERLRAENLHHTTPEIEAPYARARLRTGDIVYAIRGSIGMSALVPADVEGANLTQDAARVAPRSGINNQWLLFAVQSVATWSQLEAGVVGATVRGINIRDLKRPLMPVPPRSEQDAITREILHLTSRIDRMVAALESGIARLREYRQALITAAVTGQIEVPGAA